MGFVSLSWLFVGAVAAHNLEEAVWLPAWSQTAGRWHRSVGSAEFRFAVLVLTLLAAFAAWLATVQEKGNFGAYLVAGYALAMLLNVLVPHLLATLLLRRYMPGTATALLLILPVTLGLLREAIRGGDVDWRPFLIFGPIVVASIVALIPLLFWIGRKWGRTARLAPP